MITSNSAEPITAPTAAAFAVQLDAEKTYLGEMSPSLAFDLVTPAPTSVPTLTPTPAPPWAPSMAPTSSPTSENDTWSPTSATFSPTDAPTHPAPPPTNAPTMWRPPVIFTTTTGVLQKRIDSAASSTQLSLVAVIVAVLAVP